MFRDEPTSEKPALNSTASPVCAKLQHSINYAKSTPTVLLDAAELNENLKTMGPKAAKLAAENKTAKITSKLAAPHKPHLIAGGQDIVTKCGDRNVNSSIGTQWKTRIDSLDETASKALKEGLGDSKMHAKLNICRWNFQWTRHSKYFSKILDRNFRKKKGKNQVAKLSGAIPDNLLHYLSEYGSGGFANGLWLADPSSCRYSIAAWLSQTSIENPADFHVVSRNAFGQIHL